MKSARILFISALCCFFCGILSFPSAAATSGIYEISNVTGSNYVLDQKTCTVQENDYHSLQLFDRLDVNQQKFYLEEMPGSSWRLSVVSSGEALTVSEAEDGTKSLILSELRQDSTLSTRKVQTFRLTDAGDGTFYIQTQDGSYLTLDDSYAHRGSEILLKPFTGRANQRWTLTKTWISATDNADTDLSNPYAPGGIYEDLVISIKTDRKLERLTASQITSWVGISEEEHVLAYDSDAITAYVQGLADEYTTYGTAREFTTTQGETITLSAGTYGWKMNVEKTADRLREKMEQNGSVTMEAVWEYRAAVYNDNGDMTDSYVEVDLTDQTVWLYQDGKLLLTSDCVSGTYNNEERRTPEGIYYIYYKQSPAVLTGEDYSSPVTYWMPFNGGIGLHDASWRSQFGGEIYLNDGSHGCINLPYDVAETLYEVTYIGYPVICYY